MALQFSNRDPGQQPQGSIPDTPTPAAQPTLPDSAPVAAAAPVFEFPEVPGWLGKLAPITQVLFSMPGIPLGRTSETSVPADSRTKMGYDKQSALLVIQRFGANAAYIIPRERIIRLEYYEKKDPHLAK